MSWNYRIVKHVNKEQSKPFFALEEVYYNDDGTPGSVLEGANISIIYDEGDESHKAIFLGMMKDLAMMQAALLEPILVFDDDKTEFVSTPAPDGDHDH